jgi:hypothetical protein
MTRTPQDDLKLIQSFASGHPQIEQAARFAAWYHWRPSSAARCPRVVAGKRCIAYSQRGETCVCERHHGGPIDHPRMWLTETGERVLTAEPYDFSGDDCPRSGIWGRCCSAPGSG